MNVLLLNQYYEPAEAATARLLADLARALVADGHGVRCVCSRRGYVDPGRRYPRREVRDGVVVERVATSGFGRASRAGRIADYATFLAAAAVRLLSGPRPDVVISLTTPPFVAALGLAAARLRGAAAVYWVMDVYPDLAYALGVLRRGSLAGRLLDRLARALLRRSDRIVTLGDTMAEHLRGCGAAEVRVVPNWADGEAIRPLPIAGHPLREAWGWAGRFVVLYSGNLGMAYDFDTVLDAAALLGDRPEVLIAFVGDGPRRPAVEAGARRRGLGNVEFRPWVAQERLGLGLTAGDVHLVTLEPAAVGLLVPSKIYGILAAGRPMLYVGPDRGEVAGLVTEERCGERVAPGDAEALAALVRAYAGDPERRAGEGARARAAFDARYGRERATRAFAAVLAELAPARPGRRE